MPPRGHVRQTIKDFQAAGHERTLRVLQPTIYTRTRLLFWRIVFILHFLRMVFSAANAITGILLRMVGQFGHDRHIGALLGQLS